MIAKLIGGASMLSLVAGLASPAFAADREKECQQKVASQLRGRKGLNEKEFSAMKKQLFEQWMASK